MFTIFKTARAHYWNIGRQALNHSYNRDLTSEESELHLDGYIMVRRDRGYRRGGGVLLYIGAALKPTISILATDAQSTEGFATILCELN